VPTFACVYTGDNRSSWTSIFTANDEADAVRRFRKELRDMNARPGLLRVNGAAGDERAERYDP
jgi:hypothetical protein